MSDKKDIIGIVRDYAEWRDSIESMPNGDAKYSRQAGWQVRIYERFPAIAEALDIAVEALEKVPECRNNPHTVKDICDAALSRIQQL